MEFEYRDEVVDFKTLMIPIEQLPKSARIRGLVTEGLVPLESLRWQTKGESEWIIVRTDAWNLVRDALQPRLHVLGFEGWQLTKPLERSMTQTKQGSNLNTVLILVILGPFTVLFTWLIAFFILVTQGNGDWFQYTSAVLPLRRPAQNSSIAESPIVWPTVWPTAYQGDDEGE